jgi:hypothetical protein
MKPPLLLNENVPASAAVELRDSGYDIVAIAECGRGMSDEAVLALAVREWRWI